jgi:hypothetical protein
MGMLVLTPGPTTKVAKLANTKKPIVDTREG